MKVELMTEERSTAVAKWREYNEAFKKTRDPLYKQMKEVYHAIKTGSAVIDFEKAIRDAGVRENGHPNLAIAPATQKQVFCRYANNGTVLFSPFGHWKKKWSGPVKGEVEIPSCFPAIKQDITLKAPIPIIPPRLRPVNLTDDYYILWEVDQWTPMPSRDPYLLRRISKNLGVVCAAWDLTDIELAVMAGRVR